MPPNFSSLDPWVGYFLSSVGTNLVFLNVGNLGVDRIDLTFRLQKTGQVPEPQSLALTVLSLGMLGALRRCAR